MSIAHAQWTITNMHFCILDSKPFQGGTGNSNDCTVFIDCKDQSTRITGCVLHRFNAVHLMYPIFLAHRIRIYDILPWDRKTYLTKAILPWLSREGYIHWLNWNSRTWSSSDVIVILK